MTEYSSPFIQNIEYIHVSRNDPETREGEKDREIEKNQIKSHNTHITVGDRFKIQRNII